MASPSKIQKRLSITELYEDVLFEIFIRCPLKTLTLLRLVCKSWNSLLSSPSFFNHHLNSSTRRSFRLSDYSNKFHKFCHVIHLCPPLETFASLTIQRETKKSTPIRRILPLRLGYDTVGIAQGVVCVAIAQVRIAILWNPSLHKSVIVPIRRNYGGRSVYGFGFCSANMDFKLVRIRFVGKRGEMMQLSRKYEVLCVREGKNWKKGEIDDKVISSTNHHYYNVVSRRDCFSNGNIHWILINEKNEYSLLVFDCEKDEFRTMELPDGFSNVLANRVTLSNYNGEFMVFKESVGKEYEAWAMKEYGESSSWIKNPWSNEKERGEHLKIFAAAGDRIFEESMGLVYLKERVFSSFYKNPNRDMIVLGPDAPPTSMTPDDENRAFDVRFGGAITRSRSEAIARAT